VLQITVNLQSIFITMFSYEACKTMVENNKLLCSLFIVQNSTA